MKSQLWWKWLVIFGLVVTSIFLCTPATNVYDADGNLVRRVTEYGEFCLRASYDDDAVRIHDTMEEWYFALASAKGLQAENP